MALRPLIGPFGGYLPEKTAETLKPPKLPKRPPVINHYVRS